MKCTSPHVRIRWQWTAWNRKHRLYLAGVAIGTLTSAQHSPTAWSMSAVRDCMPALHRPSCHAAASPSWGHRQQVCRLQGWHPLRAITGVAESGFFGLTLQANEAISTGLSTGTTLTLLPVLFVAGLLSSLNPCSVGALPAAVASVVALGSDRVGVTMQACAFAAGSGTVLALLGLGASALGEQLLLSEGQFQWLFPAIAVLMGLSLLGLMPFSLFNRRAPPELLAGVPRELQGYFLGAASAVGSSPCATPVLVTVTSYLASHPKSPGISLALFLSYSLGYSAPLAVAAAFAGALPLLQSGSRFSPRLAGAAILCVGTEQLVTLGEERVLGPAPPGTLGIVMALVAAVALVARVAGADTVQTGTANPPSEIIPVLGEAGVYRYIPANGALTDSSGASASSNDDNRRASLAAVCFGAGLAGALKSTSASPDSPPAIIRAMAERSRPLSLALLSGKPLVVDFSATWCADCLKLAPALRDLKEQYAHDVEFVTLDVSYAGPTPGLPPPPDSDTPWWAREFGVDGIPHLAFVDRDGRVRTALVGDVPPEIIRADVEALRQGAATLPFVMYDAFQGGRRLSPPPASSALGVTQA